MRATFNTTCEIVSGPGATPPNEYKGEFACRHVLEDAITTVGAGAPVIFAYLTIETEEPTGAWTLPILGLDTDLADRVYFADPELPAYYVLYTVVIDWLSQTPYYRSYLVKIPNNPVLGAGGVLLGGVASVRRRYLRLGEGGVLVGGAAVIGKQLHIIGLGGVLAGGFATIVEMRTFTGEGGVLIGGTAEVVFTPGGSTTFWEDSFTDTNGTNLSAHTGETTPGGYTSEFGTFSIQSNKVVPTTFGGAVIAYYFDPATTAGTVTVDFLIDVIANNPNFRGFSYFFRMTDRNNMMAVRVLWNAATNTSSVWDLVRITGGTLTVLLTGSATFAAGAQHTLTIVWDTGNIDVDVDGDNNNIANSFQSTVTQQACQILSSPADVDGAYFDNLLVVS